MKLVSTVSRIVLGLIFVVFGLNHIHNFLPMTLPGGVAGEFVMSLVQSHLIIFVAGLEVVSGLLLLFNRYVALGLTLLGPIIVVVFLFNALMAPSGLPIAFLVVALFVIVMRQHRAAFEGLFQKKS